MMNKIFQIRCCICYILLLILGLVQPALAQVPEVAFQEMYAVLPQKEVRHIIRQQALKIARTKDLDMRDFDARMAGIMQDVEGVLVSNFYRNNNIPANATSPAKKLQFAKLVEREAALLLSNNKGYISKLFARDFSDRVLSFHSDIQIHKDGKIEVTENITIYNGNGEFSPDIDYALHGDPNNDIKRGIVRDFPTDYVAKDGFWVKVPFDVQSVQLNGSNSPYLTEDLDNGVRLMVGSEDVMLPEGIHTYTFHYFTDRQLIYHTDKDELYWNVNGTGWVFSADSVSCTVHFPEGSKIKEQACYTGFQGSTDQHCFAQLLNDSVIHFYNARRLDSYQGLTIAAAIEKGVLLPPAPRNVLGILTDNKGVGVLGGLVIFLALFYTWHWHKHGRDPKKGTIIPQLEPPAGLSPADTGFILTQKYGSHLFAAALVDLAVHKVLQIEVEIKRVLVKIPVYTFNRPVVFNRGMQAKCKELYGFEATDLYGQKAERGVYNSDLKKRYDALSGHLKNRFEIKKGRQNTWHGLFVTNDGYTMFGGFLVFLAFVFSIFYLVNAYTPNILAFVVLNMVLLLILQNVFVRIMSAYTEKGRAIADHIEGFKMYLETAEQRLLDYLTPPEKTLDLYEKYLPYAIALEVDNAWSKKFDSIMQNALEGGYQPTYYRSSSGMQSFGSSFSMGDMSKGISAGLSSTVASASTPPSSSGGGSGGGGSSGGGGGGGGGGGW